MKATPDDRSVEGAQGARGQLWDRVLAGARDPDPIGLSADAMPTLETCADASNEARVRNGAGNRRNQRLPRRPPAPPRPLPTRPTISLSCLGDPEE